MITNPEWLKPKETPYFHQISLDCIDKLVECIERFNKCEIDADTSYKISKQILVDEFDDPEFLTFVHNCLRDVDAVIVKERVHHVNVQKPMQNPTQANISINIK